MNLQKIENEALHLPKEERAALMQKLVLSFDMPNSQELKQIWLSEAESRSEQIDSGLVKAVPGNEVLKKARALIK